MYRRHRIAMAVFFGTSRLSVRETDISRTGGLYNPPSLQGFSNRTSLKGRCLSCK